MLQDKLDLINAHSLNIATFNLWSNVGYCLTFLLLDVIDNSVCKSATSSALNVFMQCQPEIMQLKRKI